MSPGDGEHVSHDTKHDQHHDMNLTPPFGTILAVGALSVTILAGAVVIVATTLPAAD